MYMKTLLHSTALSILCIGSTFSQAINEGFASVLGLTAAGWNQQNLSTPLGSNPNWFQGDNSVFTANSGAINEYIAVNFNSVSGANTISNWLLTPTLNLSNGDVISFYTRTVDFPGYADNLQLRLSTSGASTNVGASNTSVGDFTTLLTEVNPSLTLAGYPTTWTQYTVTITGLIAPTTGRIALRYYVPNGGPSGLNSDYIGIDDFVYAPVPSCNLTATASVNNAMGGAPNGTVTLNVANGTGPITYLWSSGQITQNLSGLAPGTYSVTVTDSVGCTASATANVFNVAGPTVLPNSNVVSSYQVVNGGFTPQWVCQNDTLYTDGGIMKIYLESGATMITGGGIDTVYAKTGATIVMSGGIHVIYHEPGVNLVMNGGIPTLFPCPSLAFNYSQAPANGCAPVPVCNISVSTSITNVDCNGQASGSAIANVVGGTAPLTYTWSNGSTSQTANNLLAGNYTVIVIDSNGCTATEALTITESSALNPLFVITDNLCAGQNSGSVDLTVSGGSFPYAYSWSNGSTSEDISNLAAGSYTITVTDSLGCTATSTVTVTQPSTLVISTSTTDEMMGMDGTATANVNGGTAPYTYDWTPGGMNTASVVGLNAGTYTLIVMDANGCGDTVAVQVGSQVGLDDQEGWIVSVFPNPVKDELHLLCSNGNEEEIKLELFTLDGKCVWTAERSLQNEVIVPVQAYPSGMYQLRISASKGSQRFSFVKE